MGKMIIRSFEEENKRRKTMRLVLALISVPFVIIILLFATKVLTMTTNAGESVRTFTEGDFAASEAAAKRQQENNFIQPWLAYYNSGTALTGAENWTEGIDELSTALDIAGNSIAQCQIRANLAIAYEGYGDEFTAAENTVDADAQYTLALEVIEEAPADCFPPNSGSGEAEEGESLEQTEERVEDKQGGESSDSPDPAEGEEPQPAEEGPTAEEEIDEQLDQSNEDRAATEAEERGSENAPSSPVDKPW